LSHKNTNILTAEDVVSVLPGHRITVTAMYRTIECGTLWHEEATVLPPAVVNAWATEKANKSFIGNLIQYFRPTIEGNRILPKTIYILPPHTKTPEGLAICSVTQEYCSTLLFGVGKLLPKFKNFLEGLFKIIFSVKFPENGWWGGFGGLSWDRFHKVSIDLDLCQRGAKSEDIGAFLLEIISHSISTGCRGLGELLGFGRHAHRKGEPTPVYASHCWDDPNGFRLRSMRALARSTEVFRLSSHAKRSDGDAKETQTGGVNLQRDSEFVMDSEEDDCDGEDISFCDFSDILDKMASINMDDGQNIESRIAGELKPEERAALILTAEDESKIIAALGASLNEGKLRKSSL
jgi:hypothetical protein